MGHQDPTGQPKPTYIPEGGAVLDLIAADEVPHAGHPVGEQGEGGHEQREHDGAVLRVAVQLLQKAQQAQQTHCLQQVDAKVLKVESEREKSRPSVVRHGQCKGHPLSSPSAPVIDRSRALSAY